MKYLIHALHAELLKTKRTLAFWLALIAPAVVVGLQVAMMWDQHKYYLDQANLIGTPGFITHNKRWRSGRC